jgi:hypothetical protein
MATKHTLSASAWTDIGPLPLAIKQDTTDAVEIDYSATTSIPPCKKPCNCLLCDGDDPGWELILAIAEEKELLAGSLGLDPAEQQELFLSQASVSKLSASELEIVARIQSKAHESDNQLASAIDPARKKSDPLASLNTVGEERG